MNVYPVYPVYPVYLENPRVGAGRNPKHNIKAVSVSGQPIGNKKDWMSIHSDEPSWGGLKTEIFLLEIITDIKKSFPCHQIPGGCSHYHPTLLQGSRKKKGNSLGRRNHDSITNGC